MSTTIDERVVEMRFDNKHFESNVSTTMSTLEKLKESLSLKGSARAVESEFAAYKSGFFSFKDSINKMWASWEHDLGVRMKNIAKTMVNDLFGITSMKTGFQEYETQINAVQTILANTESKGTKLEDVNSALDELNKYADKTIYNFTEMTRNIGTFTAAGVDLDTSVNAIQGIANLAAVSGSTSQQASTAMYQLSQAMASGTVKLMDWNSVVNAGMGGEVFQNALKETAKVHGVAIDDIIAKQGSFRESLSEGWLTTEILTDTLAKFTMSAKEGSDEWNTYKKSLMDQGYSEAQAEKILKMANTATDAATKVKTFTQLFDTLKEAAQSGWTQTWEILVGDFEEAKELLTTVSEVVGNFINQTSEARNEMLENWKVMGGRTVLIEALKNAFEALVSVAKPIRDAFKEMFPPLTSKRLLELTKSFRDFTAKLKLSDKASDNLKRTFKGLFAIADIVFQIFGALYKAIRPLFGGVVDLSGGILGVTARLGDFLVGLSEFLRESNLLTAAARGIAKVFELVIKGLKAFVRLIKMGIDFGPFEAFRAFIDSFRDGLEGAKADTESFGSAVSSAFSSLGDALEGSALFQVLKSLWSITKSLASLVGKVLGTLIGGLADKLANADFDGILKIINTISLSALLGYIVKFVKGLSEGVGTFNDFKEGISDILEGVSGAFKAFQNSMNAEAIKKLAIAIAILAAALVVLSVIDKDRLMDAIGAISILFIELTIAMKALKSAGELTGGAGKIALAIAGISIAVLILASALKKMATLDNAELIRGLVGVTALLVVLSTTLIVLKKFLNGGAEPSALTKSVKSLIPLVLAIYILASACKKLGSMSWEEWARGMAGITILLGVLTAVMIGLSRFQKAGDEGGSLLKATGSMLILAAAIALLIPPLMLLSTLNWQALARGGAGLAGILVLLVGSIAVLSLLKNGSLKSAASIAIIAAVITMLIPPFILLSTLNWEAIGRGATALVAILGIIVGAVALLSLTGGGGLAAAGAILVVSAALLGLTGVLLILGAMSWESIAKGLITIAGAFAIIGVAGLLLSPIIGPILLLGAALALVGVGILSAGLGFVALGVGLTAISAGLAALAGAATVVAKSLPVIATVLIAIVSAIFVGIVKGIGEGIIAICQVIIEGAPLIGEAIKTIVFTLVDVLIECAPALATGLLELIVQLLAALAEYAPTIVGFIFEFIIAILDAIAANLGPLIEAAVNVFMAFITGVIDAICQLDTSQIGELLLTTSMLTLIMAELAAMALLAPAAMAGVVAMGLVIAELSLVLAAIGALSKIPGLEWLIGEGGDFLQKVGTAIGQFIGGIAGGIMSGITSEFPKMAEDLSKFMANIQPFIEGSKGIDSSALTGVKNLVEAILLITAANLLDTITSWISGGNSIDKFSKNIKTLGDGLKSFSTGLGGINTDNVKTKLENLVDALKQLKDIKSSTTEGFSKALKNISATSVKAFVKVFDDLDTDLKDKAKVSVDGFVDGVKSKHSAMETAGEKLGEKLADGIENEEDTAEKATKNMAGAAADAAREKYKSFKSAGSYLVDGFAAGISENTYKASAKAKAMAEAAVEAAKKALNEHSPSKVFYEIGDFAGLGFVNALDAYVPTSYKAGSEMAESAKSGLSDAISKVKDFIASDMDTQPTIRPVLDLSDVRSGAGFINSLFGDSQVGVLANVGSINTMMNRNNQNGGFNDVVSSIDKLRKDLHSIKSETYNINGVTYNGDGDVEGAVRTLVRAARMERRV